MAKVAFLVFHGFAEHNGISKKIHYQVDALRQCGNDVTLCYVDMDAAGNHRWMADDQELYFYGHTLKAKVKKRFDFSPVYKYIIDNQIDWVYIRYNHNASPFFIRFAKDLKAVGIKTMLEIPTYPYDNEYKTLPLQMKMEHWADCCFRKRLVRHITRIVTFSNDEKIWGCPTVQISNGIDFSAIKLKTPHPSATIHLTGVADIKPWHGYDRAIAGLADYYAAGGTESVVFDIVGGGPRHLMEQLQGMVAQKHLEEHVRFHGPLFGDALDDIFDHTDMGIASLGRHRSGITHIKTLKNREFAARGIPFVYSEIDDDFETMPYALKAPADESPLDLVGLLDFIHNNCKLTPSEIRASIEKKLSWTTQMGKIGEAVKMMR